MDLFNDPQTIPFIVDSSVHLPRLKNQIDRRILKIIAMIQCTKDREPNNSQQLSNKSIQTQSTPQLPIFEERNSLASQVLGVSKKFNPNTQGSEERGLKKTLSHKKKKILNDKQNVPLDKPKQRPLRQIRPGSILYEEPQFIKQEPSLIQSNGFTFKRIDFSRNQSSAADIQDVKEVSDSKVFEKRHFPMKLSCIEMCGNISEGHQKNQNYFDFRDNARSQIGRMSLKTDFSHHSGATTCKHNSQIKGFPFRSKRKMTENSLTEQRIEVNQQILQKMKRKVQQIIPRRRKEFWDSKARLNVLKKIEERYNPDLYDN